MLPLNRHLPISKVMLKAILKRISVLSVVILGASIIASCIPGTGRDGSKYPPPSSAMMTAFDTAENDFKTGRYDSALTGYKYCINEFPLNSLTDNALVRAGDIYLARGDFSSAKGFYLKVVQDFLSADTYDEARYKLGYSHYISGNYYDAIEVLKAMAVEAKIRNNAPQVYMMLAKSYLMINDYFSSVIWFSAVAETTDDLSIKVDAINNIKLMVEEYLYEDELIEIADQLEGRPAGGYASYNLAKRYTERGDLDDAREELLKIVRNQPEHEYYYEAQGMLRENTGGFISGEITVGVILPLSGRSSAFGNKVKVGMELASGAMGFTDGPRINLIFKDSRGDPTYASYAVKELEMNDDVSVIVGPMIKEAAESAAYEAQGLSIPIITLTRAKGITEIGDYVFRNFLTNLDEVRGLVRYLVQSRGLTRFAILYPDEPYGNEMKELFAREVGYYGCSVVAETSYLGDTADFRSTIKEMLDATGSTKKSLTFDAIFIPDYYNTVGLVIPYIFYYDIKGVTLIGTDGWNDQALLDITGDFILGAYFADAFTPNSSRPEIKEFVSDYNDIYGKDPGVLEAIGYDTIKMIQYLVKTQGVDDRDEMKVALYSIRDFYGVTGSTTIERNGESTKEPLILTVMEKEGEPIYTITEEPEEGVAIAEELDNTPKKRLIIVEVPDSIRY